MKRVEINSILDNSSIKNLVDSQKGGSWKLHDILIEELGEGKCPSETAIITYIRKQLNFIWDKEEHLWIAYKEDTNPTKKGRKKSEKKSSKTLSISNDIGIKNTNNSVLGDENLSINESSRNFNLSEKGNKVLGQNSNFLESKNEKKIISNSTENKTTNSAKKGKKKGRKESTETFTKTYEIEIDHDDNSIIKDEDLSIRENSTNSNPSEKPNEYSDKNSNHLESANEEKNTSNNSNINQSKKIYNTGKSISSIEDSSSSSNSKSRYKNIDPSQYAEYIESNGSEKYSLSLSPFVIGLVQEIISEKYNKKLNNSKMVQLALLEFIRINTKDIVLEIDGH